MKPTEIARIAESLLERSEVMEVDVNFQAARMTVVIDPYYVEDRMKSLLDEARKVYEHYGKIVEFVESENYIGAIEAVLEVKEGELAEVERVAAERGDFIQSVSITQLGMRVKILLDSASVERAIKEVMDYLKKLGGVVEFVEAELETSKLAIFSPMSSISPGVAIFPPLRYKAYVDVCLKVVPDAKAGKGQ